MSSELAPATKTETEQPAYVRPLKLTKREIEVLTLKAEGFSDTEVASKIFVSPRTVHFHMANIRYKLGVNNATRAIREATRRGLMPPSVLSGGAA